MNPCLADLQTFFQLLNCNLTLNTPHFINFITFKLSTPKQVVDVLDVVERVVLEELQFGDDAELFPDAPAEKPAQVTAHLVDLSHDPGLRLVRRAEDAQMNSCVRHVTGDVDLRHGDHHVAVRLYLPLKYLTKLLLYQLGNFLLSLCFHNGCKITKKIDCRVIFITLFENKN